MDGIKFNWTLTVGDLITLSSALIIAGSFLFRSGVTLTRLQNAVTSALAEISELKGDIKQMGQILTELAVQKEQINMIMKWYDELRRGRGWVQGQKGVDREY